MLALRHAAIRHGDLIQIIEIGYYIKYFDRILYYHDNVNQTVSTSSSSSNAYLGTEAVDRVQLVGIVSIQDAPHSRDRALIGIHRT